MATTPQKRLTVRSEILRDDEAPGMEEVTEFTVPVTLQTEEDALSFTYTEQGEGGATVCHVRLTQEGVFVSRRGATVCDMHFGEADDEGTYEVPPFKFPFTLHTLRIRDRMKDTGGKLDIFYRMDLGGDRRRVHLRMTVA